MYSTKTLITAALTVALIALIVLPAYSQTDTERATREVDRSFRRDAEKQLRTPPRPPEIEKEEVQKEKVGPSFFIKKIQLIGCETCSPDEFRPLIEPYENKNVTMDDLNALAKEIEKAYLRKGIIAACFVPPQDIKNGVVTLQVVEAKMGVLDIKDHNYFKKSRLRQYWKTESGEVLRYEKISRNIQLMNRNPDRDVTATLHAGKKPETTDVTLNVDTNFPAHLTASFDREGQLATGINRSGVGVRHNNVLGFDDTVLGGYLFGKYFDGYYTYYKLPVTDFGTSFMTGLSRTKAVPKKDFASTGINSQSRSISFFLYQDLFKRDEYLGEAFLGLDARDKTIRTNEGTSNRDRLRIIRAGGTLVSRNFGGITYLQPLLSQGVDFFGARERHALSSRDAESDFTKLNFKIQHKAPLPEGIQAVFTVNSQLASTKLTPQEQFSLGGINSVRGYPPSDYLADAAFLATVEILAPPLFLSPQLKMPGAKTSLRDDISLVCFYDYGYGRRRGKASTDKRSFNPKSVGTGIRIRLYERVLLRLEWGFPIGDATINESTKSFFHFAIDFET